MNVRVSLLCIVDRAIRARCSSQKKGGRKTIPSTLIYQISAHIIDLSVVICQYPNQIEKEIVRTSKRTNLLFQMSILKTRMPCMDSRSTAVVERPRSGSSCSHYSTKVYQILFQSTNLILRLSCVMPSRESAVDLFISSTIVY